MVWDGYFRGAASFGEDKQQSYHAGTRICPSHTRVLLGSAVTYAAGNSTRGGVVLKVILPQSRTTVGARRGPGFTTTRGKY